MVAAGPQDTAPKIDDWLRRERERVRTWRAHKSATGRDIGRLPPVRDPDLKRRCLADLALFAPSYFPETFDLPFSADHFNVIGIMQRAIMAGGLFVLAMPRGSGKTSLCEVAALWAALYGYHAFVLLVAATAAKARELLVTIKSELATNERLLADFPEACFPIHALEGITNRAAGQRFAGAPTYIRWTDREVVLPTIPDSPASGAIIRVAGITAGNIRGQKFKRPDGRMVRPSLVIPDDPQTDRSAASPLQCNRREQIIKGALLRAAGPGKKITMIIPCTVIAAGDLADRLLDRSLNPEFQGLRTKTLYRFPSDMKLWEQYAELRADSFRRGNAGREATAFYAKHRAAMDAGAEVAWPERFEAGELSGLQSAMNVYLSDRHSFAAEYQNEPLRPAALAEVRILSAEEICHKLNHTPRGDVPLECSVLTAFIDVQQEVLFWLVAGWAQDFSGAIVDFGAWPDQEGMNYFTLTNLRRTIADAIPAAAGIDERHYEALSQCTAQLCAREFRRSDGAQMRIARVMVDANYQTKTVKKFCRYSSHAGLLLPSHGRGIGATNAPISQYQKKEGEKRGEEWLIGRPADDRALRHVIFDANYWKTFVHNRLSTGMGGRGSLSLCGDRPGDWRMLADHLVAEKPVLVQAKGRKVVEWKLPPDRPDNHGLDCLVGAAVGASIDGCQVLAHKTPPPAGPKRRKPGVIYH